MGNIAAIAQIADDREKAKDIAYRVQKKRDSKDYRCFADILMEEIAKEKATKDTNQSSPR
jgi:hypothetical protein